MPQDLLAPDADDVPPMKQLAPFEPLREQFERLKSTAETLTVTSIDDRDGMKLARATRLALKSLRCAVEDRRRELGEYHLRETQRINGDAKNLRSIIEPLELRMLACEHFAEREAERVAAEKHTARTAELAPFLLAPAVSVGLHASLGTMPDADYAALLADTRAAHAARLAREAQEQADAAAAAKKKKEDDERLAVENARLKKEADAREAQARAEAKKAADALAKVKADADAKAKAAKAKADAEAKKLRDEAAAAAAELKRIADAKAKEEAAKLAADEAAAAAPDKAKLAALAATLRNLPMPEMKSKGGKSAMAHAQESLAKLAEWLENRI